MWMLSFWKWKKNNISKLYPCISSSVFPLFAEHLIQILSYSRTVKPSNQFWVLHIFHLNALCFLLICSGFNLSLGLALHGSSGILSSVLRFWTTVNFVICRILAVYVFGGEGREGVVFLFFSSFKSIWYAAILVRAEGIPPLNLFFESCLFCSHAFSVSLCCFQIYMHALPNKPQFS